MNWKSHYGVPPEFRVRMPFPYPPTNTTIFEEWFYDNYPYQLGETGRQYLPIFFNGYLVRSSFGNDKAAVSKLQTFVDSLSRDRKYFCIHQFDHGTMIDFGDLDIMCFGMSGGRIDYPLPLLCAPHKFNVGTQKNLFANFVGRNTHPLREKILRGFSGRGIYVSEVNHPLRQYCEILGRSSFTIAVRGVGKTSFRLAEALEYGSIPVYLSDEFIFPHNMDFNEYGVVVQAGDVGNLEKILHSITHEEIERKQKRGREVYNEYFTFEKNRDIILNIIK